MKTFFHPQDLGDITAALAEAQTVKKDRFAFQHLGRNKTLLMVFFNNSLRTRLSTQKAVMNLGMNVIVLDVNAGAWKLETERVKAVLTWAPHCRALPQAVPNSFAEWMLAAPDVDLVITHPEGYELDPQFTKGATIEYDQKKAFEGADFVYAKNWSCPGITNPADYGKIISKDMTWTVDAEHMSWTNNGKFMHCLPVRRGLIVTDDVIESKNSLVIPEAANREISAQVVIKRILESI